MGVGLSNTTRADSEAPPDPTDFNQSLRRGTGDHAADGEEAREHSDKNDDDDDEDDDDDQTGEEDEAAVEDKDFEGFGERV